MVLQKWMLKGNGGGLNCARFIRVSLNGGDDKDNPWVP